MRDLSPATLDYRNLGSVGVTNALPRVGCKNSVHGVQEVLPSISRDSRTGLAGRRIERVYFTSEPTTQRRNMMIGLSGGQGFHTRLVRNQEISAAKAYFREQGEAFAKGYLFAKRGWYFRVRAYLCDFFIMGGVEYAAAEQALEEFRNRS